VVEPVREAASIAAVVDEIRQRRRVVRTLDLETGAATVTPAAGDAKFAFDERLLVNVHGPHWRLILIGAGHLARYLAQFGQMLGFSVFVSDPRPEYREQWSVDGAPLLDGMPDDAVLALGIDAFTAVVTTAHDPKVDDMALLEALKSEAFYIGALGSSRTSASRRTRLAMFDLTPAQIDRLHAPPGIPIGSHTPPEIALSIIAEVIAARNGKPTSAAASATNAAPA